MLRKLVVRSGGVLKVVCNESESHEAAVKSVNPVTIFRGDFEFAPDLRLKVKTRVSHIAIYFFRI